MIIRLAPMLPQRAQIQWSGRGSSRPRLAGSPFQDDAQWQLRPRWRKRLQSEAALEVEVALDGACSDLVGSRIQDLDTGAAQFLQQKRSLVHELGRHAHAIELFGGARLQQLVLFERFVG